MIRIEIPGRYEIAADNLVLDYNGTIAVDGKLVEGVAERLRELSAEVSIHVLTADTYGTAAKQCEGLGVKLETFPRSGAAECKLEIVQKLEGGAICIGNGYNDIPMFDASVLSIAVLEREGMCAQLLSHADILVSSICDALDLMIHQNRMRATLRS